MSVRANAARALGQVLGGGASLSTVLPPALDRTDPRDRGLLQELCHGVCRWHPQLQAGLDRLLARPLDPREHIIRALLFVGLYQLQHLRIPEHAAVAETVAAARELRKPWAVGLTNAVLRAALRRRAELDEALETDPVACTAHPRWLLERLQRDWPDDWPAIIAANNVRPPFTLRINLHHRYFEFTPFPNDSTASAVLGGQTGSSPICQRVANVETALMLSESVDPVTLPGFAEGWISVQDAAAQLAAPLLEVQPGMRVLDACAAPGGKTGHLLECASDLDLTALDQDATRLERVRDNLTRLGLNARLVAGDARQPANWWDGVPYDRILLDAPCSATGVIRRHTDIKLLRRESDIAALAGQQQILLASLWPLLRPGGRLLYATCSVLRQENEQVIIDFLAMQPDAEEQPIIAPWGRPLLHGRQILPGEDGMDGFYYTLLVKRRPSPESA
jgi:16S rRNA (cytosine967-C5)-methyltransferase